MDLYFLQAFYILWWKDIDKKQLRKVRYKRIDIVQVRNSSSEEQGSRPIPALRYS